MQLFWVQSQIGEHNRMKDFLDDCYVCLYYPGLGDLEQGDRAAWQERLLNTHSLNGEPLERGLAELELFVHVMQDGDYVLVSDGDHIHVGDLGDYYYVDHADSWEDGSCHRRGVTWLKSLPSNKLSKELQQFMDDTEPLARYPHPVTDVQMEQWLSALPAETQASAALYDVDVSTVAEAVSILKQAMQSDDTERRERAAIAILQYVSYSQGAH